MDEVRAAFRARARVLHPDVGGDDRGMADLLAAYREILERPVRQTMALDRRGRTRVERDIASFTVDELPVVAFEGLLLVANALGDIADEDPPYLLEFVIRENGGVWCRCDIVPEAGGSMVSVAVAPVPGGTGMSCEAVRDILVAELNSLDWGSGTA